MIEYIIIQGEWTTRSSRKARKKAPSTETEEASQNKVSFGRLTNRTGKFRNPCNQNSAKLPTVYYAKAIPASLR